MGFEVSDDFDANTYVRVNDRLNEFWDKHPGGAIVTTHSFSANGILVMKAEIYKNASDTHPSGTGHGFSTDIDGDKVGEFTETVAVGRALANMGFKIEKSIASSEEMNKFNKKRRAKADPSPEERSNEEAPPSNSSPNLNSKLKPTKRFKLPSRESA